jgi:cell division transport system ATP-binding protein
MNLFEQFNDVGVTLLIATHDLELISRMNRRILVLEKSRLARDNAEPVN